MRRALLIALVVLGIAPGLAQAAPPANDNFATPAPLTGALPIQVNTTNVDATTQPGEPAAYPGGASIWFTWTPSSGEPVTIDLCGSDFDTTLAIYLGDDLFDLSEEGAADDTCGNRTRLAITRPEPGTTYRIAVDGFNGATGAISLKVREPAGPPNDDFAAAEPLTGDFYPLFTSGSNVEAGKEPGEPDHAGEPGGASIWYRWTPQESGVATVRHCGFTAGGPVAVYTGTAVDDLTEIASARYLDASCGTEATFPATAGVTYSIALDSLPGPSGAIAYQGRADLSVRLIHPPPNDAFADARVLDGPLPLAMTGTNEHAGKEPGEPDHAGDPGGASVWYQWTAEDSGEVTIDTCAGNFDSLLAVYTGTVLDELTPVTSNDDGCGGLGGGSQVTFTAAAGQTYQLAIDGFRFQDEPSIGDFTLAITSGGTAPPPNDTFVSAQVLDSDLPIAVDGTNVAARKEPGEPDHGGNPGGASVWYRWTPAADGQVTIDTCEGGFDSILAVYTGDAVDTLSPVAEDNDSCGFFAGASVTFDAAAGETYRIAVDGYSVGPGALTSGQFVLRVQSGDGRPANDDFADAAPLDGAFPVTVDGTNFRATAEPGEPDHAGVADGGSVWYRWTADTDGPVTIDACETDFSTALAAYTGAALDDLHVVEARVESPETTADFSYIGCTLSFGARAGTTYRIALSADTGFGEPPLTLVSGVHHLTVRPANGSVNDSFAGARVLSGPLPLEEFGQNVEATKEPGEPDHAGDPGGASLWFAWTPAVSGPVTVSICAAAFDNLLAVYTGDAVDTLTPVASNKFGCEVSLDAHAGETYRIATDGFRGATGAVSRSGGYLQLRRSRPPANDAFTDAEDLEGPLPLRTTGSNVDASKSDVEPQHDGDRGGASIWYRWTPVASGVVSIDLCDSNFDTVLAVYTGAAEGALTRVQSASGGCGTSRSRVTFSATAGTTYRIAVDGAFGDTGPVALRITQPAAAEATATCAAGEQVLGGGAGIVGSASAARAYRNVIEHGAPAGDAWRTSIANLSDAAQDHRALAVCSPGSDVTTVETPLTVPPGGVARGLATCPAGTRAVGGGLVGPAATGRQRLTLQASVPIDDEGELFLTSTEDVPQSWLAAVVNHGGAPADLRIVVRCSAASDATLVVEQLDGGPGDGVAICPDGARALSGGVGSIYPTAGRGWGILASAPVDASLSVAGTEDGATPRAWYASFVGAGSWLVAICSPTATATVRTAAVTVPAPRPQHDDFTDAYPLGATPVKTGGTNRGATTEPGEPGAADGRSVWYRWTAGTDDAILATACGSDFDAAVGVYTGPALDSLTPVGAAADPCRVTFAATAGQTYWVAVRSAGAAAGTIVLRLHHAGPPENDDRANAEPIAGALPLRATGVNLLATRETGEPTHAGSLGGASVWYRWTAPADGPVAFDTCRSDFDTALAIYTPGLDEITANDDTCGTRSRVALKAHAGREYLIAVDGEDGATGSIVLRVDTAYPPVNDDRAHAAVLGGELPIAEVTSNVDATREDGEPQHGGPGGASLWFRWTPAATGRVAVETCGDALDTLVAVYAADLTRLGADDSACGAASQVLVDVVAGRAYLIAVDGRRATTGSFTLRIESSGTGPATPALTAFAAPANDNAPHVTGTAPGADSVRLYAGDRCTGVPDWAGPATDLHGAGIAITVADDTRTEIRARSVGAAGVASGCSAPIVYAEDSTAPAAPELRATGGRRVTGVAADGTSVRLSGDGACGPGIVATGSAAELAGPGLAVPDGVAQVSGRAVDAAGNGSPCSAPVDLAAAPAAARCGGRTVTLLGTPGDDVLRGTPRPDVILAGAGNDTVRGFSGADVICGGTGDDTLRGGAGPDVLRGGPGHDLLIGGPGRDTYASGRRVERR